MNILIVNPYMAAGGTEERIKALASEFRKRGHKTSFLITGEPGVGRESPEFAVYQTTPAMSKTITRKIIERDKINIVQQHNYQGVGNGAILAAEQARIPSVYYAHDFCSICAKRFLADATDPNMKQCDLSNPRRCDSCVSAYDAYVHHQETAVLEHATLGIAPSQYFANTLEQAGPLKGKWKIVTPWINPYFHDFFWSGYCSNTLLFAGNLFPGKGIFTLVKALPAVAKEVPDVSLRIFAGGPFAPVVLEAKRLHVADRLQYSQPILSEQLVFEYVNAGCVCFPSRLPEAFGLVWAEAMNVGTPVICSSVGSIPELSQGRVPLVNPESVSDWSEAILTVLQDRQESVKVARENKTWATEQFSVEKAADSILKLYEGLL